MTNKQENSSIFFIHPRKNPNPNDDKIESTRSSNFLVKRKNITVKRDQENHHESRKFNDAVTVHASACNEGGSMKVEDNVCERLKRHRVEVAGRVWIPEIWGQEELLKDWIDCSTFDESLMNNDIMSARAALVEERRKANSTCRLSTENSCSNYILQKR